MKNVLVSNLTTNDVAFILGSKVAYMGTTKGKAQAVHMAVNNKIGTPSAKIVALELKDDSVYLYLEIFMTNKGQGATFLNPRLVRHAGRTVLIGLQSSGGIAVLAIG